MVKILSVHARQVLDSRGNPTVEAELSTTKGSFSAIVPSGASTGAHEAIELRDNAKEYGGKGVLKAVENVNSAIAPKVVGKEFYSLEELDHLLASLDGTANKSSLGANAILPVSMAFCRALAANDGIRLFEYISKVSGSKEPMLPVPFINVLNGGKHAGRENDIQEHMIVPSGFGTFSEAMRAGVETYHALKAVLKKKYGSQATLLGDEGGFCPKDACLEDRLEFMQRAIEETGYSGKVHVALDCASSEFYNDGVYTIGNASYTPMELVDFYAGLVEKFGLVSIEDAFSEDDWKGWRLFNSKLGKKIEVVGDDLLVTSVPRIRKAIEYNACNALLLKVNQIGTLTESMEAARLAMRSNWKVMVSHRSGESEDAFIADLVVGLGSGQSKFGAPARSERTAKYNQLLRIEEALASSGARNTFAGGAAGE